MKDIKTSVRKPCIYFLLKANEREVVLGSSPKVRLAFGVNGILKLRCALRAMKASLIPWNNYKHFVLLIPIGYVVPPLLVARQ